MKKTWSIAAGMLLFLILIRISLPFIVEWKVNDVLEGIPDYTGEIEGVNINLLGGAYAVNGISFQKTEEEFPMPFVEIERVLFSVSWAQLFKGRIEGSVALIEPVVNFVTGPEKKVQYGVEVDWTKKVKEFMPVQINYFRVENGKVNYSNIVKDPELHVYADSIYMEMTNLSNVEELKDTLPSSLSLRARTMGGGDLYANMNMDVLQTIPDFNADITLERVRLTAFNRYLKSYLGADVEEGYLSVYTEVFLKNRRLTGYVKPFLKDIRFVKEEGSKLQDLGIKKLWEGFLQLFVEPLQKEPQETVATKIPVEGQLQDTQVGVWVAIYNLLKHAYVEAFRRELERTVPLREIKTDKE